MSFNINKYLFNSDILLKDAPSVFHKEFENISQHKALKKGTILYKENTAPKQAFYIKKGKIKVEQLNENGVNRIVYIFSAGEYFGFRPLFSGEKNPVTATTIEDSELVIYDGKKFVEVAKLSPIVTFNVVKILASEFSVWINLITSMAYKATKERVALVLLILNEKYKTDSKTYGKITATKIDIAKYAETSQETVVRILTLLADLSIIENEGRGFYIRNKEFLEKWVDEV